MKKLLTGLAAAALLAGQSAAVTAAPAQIERVSAEISDSAEAAGDETFIVIALVVAAALGAIIASSNDKEELPVAPYPTSP